MPKLHLLLAHSWKLLPFLLLLVKSPQEDFPGILKQTFISCFVWSKICFVLSRRDRFYGNSVPMKLLELFQQLRTDLLFLLMTFDPKTEEARASTAALGRHCVSFTTGRCCRSPTSLICPQQLPWTHDSPSDTLTFFKKTWKNNQTLLM